MSKNSPKNLKKFDGAITDFESCQSKENKKLDFFFYIIRCGLAHGNILFEGDSKNDISRIVFVKSKTKGSVNLQYLSLDQSDFANFLAFWGDFLSTTPTLKEALLSSRVLGVA